MRRHDRKSELFKDRDERPQGSIVAQLHCRSNAGKERGCRLIYFRGINLWPQNLACEADLFNPTLPKRGQKRSQMLNAKRDLLKLTGNLRFKTRHEADNRRLTQIGRAHV